MPGIIDKFKKANKKRKAKKTIRKAKKNTIVSPEMKKIASRTQDPVKGGSGSIKKTTTGQKIRGKAQSALSTRAKKNLSSGNKILSKTLGYSKGGFIQYD
tara:strand:+ start:250 stop:549 length:300 start_codon:yes stop_codon:yes gene_type:complete